MNGMFFSLPLLVLSATFAAPVNALAGDITVTAEEKVEIYQTEKKAVAVGNAVAVKDGMTVNGDRLTVFFADNGSGKNEITELNADGRAHLQTGKADAFGDRLEYYMDGNYVVIKGKPARVKDENASVFADNGITYYPDRGMAVAKGNVVADNGKNKIFADVMETYFKTGKDGTEVLERVEIPENPKIVTADGEVTAATGIYYPDQGKVYLYENVVISQNGNVLHGDKAETDLNTGISKVLSGGKRVSGVWYEED